MFIQLLGGFKVTNENEPVRGLTKPRMQSLLAYLLLHRDTAQLRAHLAFTFWPDSSDAQARTNLRRELLQLRRALPNADRYLLVEAQTLQWNPNADYTLDVADFLAALDAAESSRDEARRGERQGHAAAVYLGDLLPGLYDEWMLPVREELAQRYVQALEQVIAIQADARNYGAAIRAAQRLLRYDPLYETGYYRLMEIYAAQNDRARALHTYHTCASVLERELGVPPDAEIQQLYERLQHVETHPDPRPASDHGASMRLVGRTREWQMLHSTWRKVNRGKRHFVLIEGEAGIGKTRLAEELLEWVKRQGVAVARSRAYAAEGSLAYAPVVELLRSDELRSNLARLDPVWQTEIARLLPEMLVANPTLTHPEPLAEQWQRQRLFESLARAFALGGKPMLLLIDDLQWCDQETLEWLPYLLRFDTAAPILVVGTARSEETVTDHPMRALTNELGSRDQLTAIGTTALDVEETKELASLVGGETPADHTTADLFEASERIRLLLALDGVVIMVQGVAAPERETILRRVRDAAMKTGDEERLSLALGRLSFTYHGRGLLREAHQAAEERLSAAEKADDSLSRAFSHLDIGRIAMALGEFARAHDSWMQSKVLLDKLDQRQMIDMSHAGRMSDLYSFLPIATWVLDHTEQALDYAERALLEASKAEPRDRQGVPFFLAMFYRNIGHGTLLIKCVEELIFLGERYGMSLARQSGMVFRGWQLAHDGQLQQGIELAARDVDGFRRMGQSMFQTHRLAMLAELHLMAGQFEQARDILGEAHSISKRKNERFWDVELHRLYGDLALVNRGEPADAEQSYLRAIEIAQQEQAKSLELRATTALCRLWYTQGRAEAAVKRLAKLLGWFKQEIDSDDLRAARTLLDEMR